MPRGASPKREREYEELKEKFHESGRYKGREEEVASRIVNKHRAEYGETKEDKKQEREGTDADRNLPIKKYREKTISELKPKLEKLSSKQLNRVESYERKSKDRKGVVQAIDEKKKSRKTA
jgi:hypothetical protein